MWDPVSHSHCSVMKWPYHFLNERKFCLKSLKILDSTKGKKKHREEGWWPQWYMLVTSWFCSALNISGGPNRAGDRGKGSVYCLSSALISEKTLVVQTVKNLPAVQETRIWSLGQEDSLEKGTVTHSSILVWKIAWTEEPGGLQFMGLQRVRHDWVINTFKEKEQSSYF